MTLGELIILYRKEHGLSQRAFAKVCGNVSNGYVSMIENGKNPNTGKPIVLSIDKLHALASGMGMSLQDLLEAVDDMPVDISASVKNLAPVSGLPKHHIPLIGSVALGEPILAEQEYDVYVDAPIQADYALRTEGDSMSPTYLDGDIVYIRAIDAVADGSVAVVLIDDSATLKHVYRQPNGLLLTGDNPSFVPMSVRFSEHDVIRILGIPVGYTRMYKNGKKSRR